MKTFETEKNNIPEGATHYQEPDAQHVFAWFKLDGNKLSIKVPVHGENLGWDYCNFDYFRGKIKPIHKPEVVEWSGEGLPPVGCKIKTKHGVSEVLSTSDWDGGVVTYSYDEGVSIACAWNNKSWINPIETEKQRKERERLEAAYDLYCYAKKESIYFCVIVSFKEFVSDFSASERDEYLAIVDKTNYRKGE